MELTITRSELSRALNAVSKMSDKKQLTPMADYTLLTKNGGVFALVGACETGNISVRVDMECEGDFKPVCLPLSQIIPATKELSEQPLRIEVEDLQITLRYNGGSFSFVGREPDEFPEMKSMGEAQISVNMNAGILTRLLKKAAPCVAKDELRPVMMTVALDVKDETRFVASDGHMMTVLLADVQKNGGDGIILVPGMVIGAIEATFGEDEQVSLLSDGSLLKVASDRSEMVIRCPEGRYPNYASVIPKPVFEISVNRTELMSAMKRVSLFSSGSGLTVMDFKDGALRLEATDPDFSKSASETVRYDGEGAMRIGFKGVLMQALLNAMDSDVVTLGFVDTTRAITVESEGVHSILMPMVIQD